MRVSDHDLKGPRDGGDHLSFSRALKHVRLGLCLSDDGLGIALRLGQGCLPLRLTDAPPLDFMSGHLSAREVANMSGLIWNHLPAMLGHFEEEGITYPTFADEEMADLVAYLHSEGQAPASGTSGGGMGNMGGMTTTAP